VTSQREDSPDAAYNHRPPALAPTPIAIYEPAFAQFRRDMSTPTEELNFKEEELNAAAKFVNASLPLYSTEQNRLNALREIVEVGGQKLWTQRVIPINQTQTIPDGCYTLDLSGRPAVYLSLAELKNGLGNGGADPSEQVQLVYIQVVSSEQVWGSVI
jgi:hypothetical protein